MVIFSTFSLISTSKGILAVGAEGLFYNFVIHKSEILQLKCPEGQDVSDCYWDEFPQILQIGRTGHVVIPLPASYEVQCDPTS